MSQNIMTTMVILSSLWVLLILLFLETRMKLEIRTVFLWDLSYNLNLVLNSYLSSCFLVVNLQKKFWNPGISMEWFSFLHVCLFLFLSNGRQILKLVFMILISSLSLRYLQVLRFSQQLGKNLLLQTPTSVKGFSRYLYLAKLIFISFSPILSNIWKDLSITKSKIF